VQAGQETKINVSLTTSAQMYLDGTQLNFFASLDGQTISLSMKKGDAHPLVSYSGQMDADTRQMILKIFRKLQARCQQTNSLTLSQIKLIELMLMRLEQGFA
jgi:hypothetical protein